MERLQQLANMIDHSLLHPTMTDEDLRKGCELALAYNVASVCIKPYAVSMAADWLKGSEVLVGTVIGFPQGNSPTTIKVAEAEAVCRDGAIEVDMVVNIGKVLGNDWGYVRDDIAEVLAVTQAHNAILKVIFENDFLPEDSFKIKLCEICSDLNVGFVKTSTGYGMVKGSDGKYGYQGATEHDLKLMRKHTADQVEIKAAGGVRTLDDLLMVESWGVTRVGATATVAILTEAQQRFGGQLPTHRSDGQSGVGY